MTWVQRFFFVALAIAGITMIRVASGEETDAAAASRTAAVVPAAGVFDGLQPCEIPGIRERVLSKGQLTTVYAGEFEPVQAQPTSVDARLFVYIVSGTGVARIGDAVVNVKEGDVLIIPRGTSHSMRPSSSTLRAIYFEDRS